MFSPDVWNNNDFKTDDTLSQAEWSSLDGTYLDLASGLQTGASLSYDNF